jgi:hypothetical protein
VAGEREQRAIVDDVPGLGVLAVEYGPHAVVEDLLRHAPECLECSGMTAEQRRQVLMQHKAAPEHTAVAQHHREQPDDVKSLPIPTPNSRPILTPHWVLLRACPRSTAPWACGANGAGCPLCITPWIEVGVVSPAEAAAAERSSVDGGVHPRIRFAARDQPLLAIVRSDANGCSVALCQRRQPPKGGGRRPAFTEGCRTAILEHQERRLVSRRRVDRPERTISAPERTVRRYARILAAANIA